MSAPAVTLESLAAEGRMVAYPAAQMLELIRVLGDMPGIPVGMTVDGFNAMRQGLLRVHVVQAGPQPAAGSPAP